MFQNEADKQLQCIPTPDIYVSRGGDGSLFDRNNVRLALRGFEVILSQSFTTPNEANRSSIALLSLMVNGPQPATVNDSGNSAFALRSMAAITGAGFTAPSDSNQVTINLRSMVAITAQTAPTQTENSGANFALRSMIV